MTEKKSDIFLSPDQLPRLEEVLAEYQRITGARIGFSSEFANKVIQIRESGKRAVLRLARPGSEARPKLDDICILCDVDDLCKPCDAGDFKCEVGDDNDICILKDTGDVCNDPAKD